jgi:succinate-acetate transporter protein
MSDVQVTTQAVSLAIAMVAFTLFGFFLFRAGRLPHPSPIVISLSMLTAVALLLAAAQESDAFLTIAGTGIGALAGALASIYKAPPDDRKPPPDDDPPSA